MVHNFYYYYHKIIIVKWNMAYFDMQLKNYAEK